MKPTHLLSSLRAVGRFSEQPIPHQVLIDMLDIARWTAGNATASS